MFNRNISVKRLTLYLVFILLAAHSGSSAPITYATPPPVNITEGVIVLNNSVIGSTFIGSKRLESLQISQTSSSTTFKVSYFNRSAPNNFNQYLISNQPGTWQFLKGTQETLSCNLIYQTTNKTLGLLQFRNDIGVFRILARIPVLLLLSLVPSDLKALYPNLDYIQLAAAFTPAQNCQVGRLDNTIYRLSADSQSLNVVNLPSTIAVQATTESFIYGIAKNNLYRFNSNLNQYDLIYALDPYQQFTINQYGGRIIICGANNSAIDSSKYLVNQKIYYLEDEPTGLILINKISYNGYSSQQNIQIFASPQLTKMGFKYIPEGTTAVNIVTKSIDYLNNQVIDLIFDDPTHFLQTFQLTSGYQLDFSDYFLVVRNVSGLLVDPTLTPYEEAYQFIGNKIVYFRNRLLSGDKETLTWARIYVDLFYTSNLVVLDVYQAFDTTPTQTGYQVDQIQYGNYAATKKIVPPVIPPFIQFAEPTNTYKQDINYYGWIWSYYNVETSTTNITIFQLKPNKTVVAYSNVLTGNYEYIARSLNCRILHQTINDEYYIYAYDSIHDTYNIGSALTTTLGGIPITTNTTWQISQKCDRFSVDKKIFYLTSTGYNLVSNNYSTFVWIILDDNITYAVSLGNVWKFDTTQYKFVSYSSFPYTFSAALLAYVNNRVLISISNSTTNTTPVDGRTFIFIDENGGLTNIFSYHAVTTSVPWMSYSQNLTKFYLASYQGQSYSVDTYFIDYDKRTNTSISFPTQSIRSFDIDQFFLSQNFIYVRQIFNKNLINDTSYTSVPHQYFVYYLNQDILPQLLLQRNLTQDQANTYVGCSIQSTDGVNFYLALQSLQNISGVNNVVVAKTQLNPQQAKLNAGNNQAVSGYISNGIIVLCTPGCSDCSTQICTGCKTGFAFNQNTALCVPCPPGCKACDSNNPLSCSSCLNGTYLSGTSCLPCNSTCITCNNNANSCLNCFPGQFFSADAGQCMLCQRNCITCANASSCQQCRKGFAATSGGTCRGCSISCSDCNANNITQCTACGDGLQLVNSQCIQCPNNCLQCNSGICQTCIPGYSTNSAEVCVLNCKLPCATCADNLPQNCTSCYSSAILSGSTCVANLVCNQTGVCTDCSQGLNYYLFNQYCYPCSLISQISNCLQCSQSNQQLCSICQDGYYLSSAGLCPACPSICITCVGGALCTSCQTGYTLASGQTQGQCIQCQSPCATCTGANNYCTSCVSGYTKNGWKCQNNIFVGFSLVLGGTTASQVLSNIDVVIAYMLQLMNQSSTNVDAITISNIKDGSAILAGTATSTSGSNTQALAALQTGLSSGTTFGNGSFSITYSSITSSTDTPSSSKDNKALIIGLVVGLTALVVIIIVIIVFIYRLRKAKLINTDSSQIVLSNKQEPIADNSLDGSLEIGTSQKMEVILTNHLEKQLQ